MINALTRAWLTTFSVPFSASQLYSCYPLQAFAVFWFPLASDFSLFSILKAQLLLYEAQALSATERFLNR